VAGNPATIFFFDFIPFLKTKARIFPAGQVLPVRPILLKLISAKIIQHCATLQGYSEAELQPGLHGHQ
jgi:hypothetical protein